MKHKHYDMIMAKAANMDLVVFCRDTSSESHKWDEYVSVGFEGEIPECAIPAFEYGYEYFMCLPQHKEACLHWLNGGIIQDNYEGKFEDCGKYSEAESWNVCHIMMDDDAEYRIKPRKEKRWVIAMVSDGIPSLCGKQLHLSKDLAVEFAQLHGNCKHLQFIEIEVEL